MRVVTFYKSAAAFAAHSVTHIDNGHRDGYSAAMCGQRPSMPYLADRREGEPTCHRCLRKIVSTTEDTPGGAQESDSG